VTLLRALAMPFQFTSLLMVGAIAVAAALAMAVVDAVGMLVVVPLVFLLSWLNKYAFALLDHAANGERDAPVASLEMLGPFGGARPLVHVVLAVAVYALADGIGGRWGPWIIGAALLLFPASVGALAMHQRLLDAVSPIALWRTLRGLSLWYLLLLGAMAVCGAGGYLLVRFPLPGPIRYGLLELLLLCLYALIGGVVYMRRAALGFEPVVSPEWAAERDAVQHERRRQQAIDLIYGAVRVRDAARARAALLSWLDAADGRRLGTDLQVMLAQAAQWPEQRGLQTVARTAVAQLLRKHQQSIALETATTALAHAPDFALDADGDTVALARYAQLCGRRATARALLDNFAHSAPDRRLSEQGATLRRELENG
jgi:hypothetical protein